jgi:hypothetical protein
MNSRTTWTLNALAREVNAKKADEFLYELLNLREDSVSGFRRRFREWLPFQALFGMFGVDGEAMENLFVEDPSDPRQGIMGTVLPVRNMIREGWDKPTPLEREVAMLGVYQYLRDKHRNVSHEPFLLVLLRAMHIADRMRHCENPECPAPYFIAARRSQKYCSEACALPAQKEFKRTWWADHGSAWRRARATRAKPVRVRVKKGDK